MGTLEITLGQGNELSNVPIAVQVINSQLETKWKGAIALGQSHTVSALASGQYLVQALLPSGQRLSQTCEINEDIPGHAEIKIAGDSPNERLEWARIIRPAAVTGAQQRETQLRSVWLRLWGREPGGRWKVQPWPVHVPLRNPGLVQYEFPFLTERRFGQYYLQVGGPTMQWRLIALPADDIRVLITGAIITGEHDDTDSAVDVEVASKNPSAEVLLGYLARGEIEQARYVSEAIIAQDLLSGKRENPAAAAVAGYFMLGTGDLKNLDQVWTDNLANWTQWLSDGAVIDAWNQLRRESPDIARARRRLLEAVARGMPVYTRGLRLLVDGLPMFDGDPEHGGPDIRAALNRVRSYAGSADWRSATTTFIGQDPKTPGRTPVGLPADPTCVIFVSEVGESEIAWKQGRQARVDDPGRSAPAMSYSPPGVELAPEGPDTAVYQASRAALGEAAEDVSEANTTATNQPSSEAFSQDAVRRFQERETHRHEHESTVHPWQQPVGFNETRTIARLLRAADVQTQTEQLIDQTPIQVLPESEHPLNVRGLALERIVGLSDLLSVNFLQRGLATARTIGRVAIRESSTRVTAYATGFLVSPRLVLMNHHVIPSVEAARLSDIEFDYQDGPDGRLLPTTELPFDPDAFFVTNKELDFSLVALVNEEAVRGFGWNRLIDEEGKAIVGENLSLIQHADGAPKVVAIRKNQLVDIFGDFVHYAGETAIPSSGAALFNDQWEILALHHASIPARDPAGNILARDGTIWSADKGPHQIKFVGHEGVRVSSIVRDLKARDLSGKQAELRDELLFLTPSSAAESMSVRPANSPAVVASPGGTGRDVMTTHDPSTRREPMGLNEAFQRLNITVDLIPEGLSNRPGTKLEPTFITIHNTANAKPTANAAFHALYVKGADARQRQVSWHFTVDDQQTVKHLPTNEVGWHAKAGNTKSIGIEVCEHKGIDKAQAIERASLLTAVLMFQLGIPIERVVPHQFWTGKDCPHVILDEPGGFEAFRRQATGFLDQLQAPPAAPPGGAAAPPPEAATPPIVDQVAVARAMSPTPPDAVERVMIGTREEYIAELERQLGQKIVENELLRRSVREQTNNLNEMD